MPKLLRVRSNIKAVMVLTEGSWLRTSSKVVVLGNQSSESYRFIRKNTHASIKKQKTVKEEIEKEKAHKKCIKNERWSVFSKASKGQQKGTRQAPAMAAQIVEEGLQGEGEEGGAAPAGTRAENAEDGRRNARESAAERSKGKSPQ